MFWALRASRTLSLAGGLGLGQGAEEQERRARSRPRAPNIARAAPSPAGSDPACGDRPLAAAPLFRATVLPSKCSKVPPRLPSPSGAPALSPENLSSVSLSPRGRDGDNTFSGESRRETTAPHTPQGLAWFLNLRPEPQPNTALRHRADGASPRCERTRRRRAYSRLQFKEEEEEEEEQRKGRGQELRRGGAKRE